MKKLIITSIALVTMSFGFHNTYAKTNKSVPTPNNSQQQVETQIAWLGVMLGSVPEALSRQLVDIIPNRQGVMVQSVLPDSPAQKAGIKAFDIILSYDEDKIFSIEQLNKLVVSDEVDNKVIITLVSNGIKKDVTVMLGSRSLNTAPTTRYPFAYNHQHITPNFPGFMLGLKMPSPPESSETSNVMQQFESIRIQTLSDDQYRAEVDYQEYGKEKKQFVFEGKYDEVIQQITSNKELPESKKNSLLNALKNNPNWLIPDNFFDFLQIPPMPSFYRYFESDPSRFRSDETL